jgi:putative hydrolase of the HAD superfamily
MSKLPPAILFDLDDTILAAFGQAEGQWQRVIASFIEHLAPHPPHDIVAAIQAYSRFLWADQARHKHWRHRIGEARRHIVQNAFAELCGKSGQPAPSDELCDAIAARFNELQEAELRMFPGSHETLDRLKELGVKLALVTNGAAVPQRKKVVRFALEHRFDHIQIEGEHGFGKPEERNLQPCDGSARSRPARDLDGRRQPRMGSHQPSAPRHLRDLARRLRRRPAPRLPDPP